MACVRLSLERRYTDDGGGTNDRDTSVKVIPALQWHFECAHLSISIAFLLVTARLRNRESRRIFLSKFLRTISPFSILHPYLSRQQNKQVSTSWQWECTYSWPTLYQVSARSNGNWSRLLARHLTLDIILRNKETVSRIGFLNSSQWLSSWSNCWNVASGRAGFLNFRSTSRERDPPQRCST